MREKRFKVSSAATQKSQGWFERFLIVSCFKIEWWRSSNPSPEKFCRVLRRNSTTNFSVFHLVSLFITVRRLYLEERFFSASQFSRTNSRFSFRGKSRGFNESPFCRGAHLSVWKRGEIGSTQPTKTDNQHQNVVRVRISYKTKQLLSDQAISKMTKIFVFRWKMTLA